MFAAAAVYTRKGTPPVSDRNDWLERYAPLVKRIAHHMLARLPANVERDDLVQAGMIGLVDAIQRYEECQGTQFETYANQRIRGAMLDELRANDWLPRSVRKSQRQIETSLQKLEQQLGRPPSESEVARDMGLELAAYQEMLADARGCQLVHFDEYGDDDSSEQAHCQVPDTQLEPAARFADKRFKEALVAAIEQLPEREKMLMSLYYEEELNFREIAAVLGVTESRICQLHSLAVSRLRAKLKD